MANQVKYLVTVDHATEATIKVERLGSAGELVAVAPTAAAPAPPGLQWVADPRTATEESDGPPPDGPRPEEPPPDPPK